MILLMLFGIVRFFPSAFSWPSVASRSTIKSISMVSTEEGWAVGTAGIAADPTNQSYLLLHYHNGRWTREFPFREGTDGFPSHVSLTSISMISAEEGWAVGQGTLLTSSPTTTGTAQSGLLVTVILHRAFGIWTVLERTTTGPGLDTISMQGSEQGWLLGDNGANTTLLRYDGSWQFLPLPPSIRTTAFHTLVPMAHQDVWLAGATLAHYNGKTWTRYQLPPTSVPSSPIIISGLSMIAPQEGWAVGSLSNTPQGIILHYVAGRIIGQSTPSMPVFTSVTMLAPSRGWAVGAKGAIWQYQDETWTPVSSPTDRTLQQVVLTPGSDDVWAVGENDTILHSHQGRWSVSPIDA